MLAFAALIALIAVASAQQRPVISEDFYSQVNTELHTTDNVLFGQGHWAIDTTANVGIENYQFQDQRHGGKFFVVNLQRYDLGKLYEVASYDRHCNVTSVSGSMPSTWGWVAQANYSGTFDYHGITLQSWKLSIAGVTLTLGVNQNNVNIPVTYDQQSTSGELFVNFQFFNASTNFNHNIFDIPPQCNQGYEPEEVAEPVVVKARATPTRPAPSENFEAGVAVEVRNNYGPFQGQGRQASDQTGNMFVEEYFFQDQHHHEIRSFNLARYDLGHTYSINSENQTDCLVRNVTGNLPPFWGWLPLATFIGTHPINNHGVLDIWQYASGGVNITLGVNDANVNVPVWLGRSYQQGYENFDFQWWNATTPNSQDFTVPPECQ